MNRQPFIEWAEKENVARCLPVQTLEGCMIGIDAAYFLRNLGPEGVLSALGGSPLSLGARIKSLVRKLQKAGLGLYFVFDGLYHGSKSDPFAASASSVRHVNDGFALYDASNSDEANRIFKNAAPLNPTNLTRTFQKTLHDLNIPFSVAPYSALAQLSYYEKDSRAFVDFIYGPPELFCFGQDKIIYRFDFPPSNPTSDTSTPQDGQGLFYWIDKKSCLERLGNVPSRLFIDALLLSGCSNLPQYPPFTNPAMFKGKPTIKEALDAINSAGGSVSRLCAQSTDPAIKEAYLDHYKRTLAGIRHHIIMTAEGDLLPLDKENAPSDVHEFIGLRLPEELYMYLSRAVIQPTVLNWLTSGSINITAPGAGGDSKVMQDLAGTQLDPLRRRALTLLAEPIHRYFQTKEITTKLWFDKENDIKFNPRSIQPSPREALSKWHVRSALLRDAPVNNLSPGTLVYAISSLSNTEYAARTVTPKPKATSDILKTPEEIISNVIWRMMQLRGYVDEQHQLTEWGKTLHIALDAAGSSKEVQESVMIAVELLRFDALHADTLFTNYGGAPINGTDIDKRNTMLVSRVASIGKVRHKEQPFSGPLSRHLTAYQSLASYVRSILRDLLEMILAAMLMEGSADREQDDWVALSLGLPFYEEHSCALGILTLHYLDELSNREKPESKETQSEVQEIAKDWVRHSDFDESLKDAFHLWDAVYKAAKAVPAKEQKAQSAMWDEVNDWLSKRR